MTRNLDDLKPAAAEDIVESLAFALRFSGRKRVHDADETMARIVAKRLFEQLKGPPSPPHSTPGPAL
jgi:hypothetical protein